MIIFSSMYCFKVDAKRVNFERLPLTKAKSQGSDGMFTFTNVARRDFYHKAITLTGIESHRAFHFFIRKGKIRLSGFFAPGSIATQKNTT